MTSYFTPHTTTQIFNVNLVGPLKVGPLKTNKSHVSSKMESVIKKRKPLIAKRRRRQPEKKLLPETLHGKGGGDDLGSLPSDKNKTFLAPPSFLFDKKTIEKFAREGTRTKKGITFDTSEFKHRGYMRMLKEKIESVWKYPREAARLGISGDLYIKFSIKRTGKLGKIELLRTSGYRDLDVAAIKALKDAEPYWPLPEDWEKDALEIKGHFIYIYGNTYLM